MKTLNILTFFKLFVYSRRQKFKCFHPLVTILLLLLSLCGNAGVFRTVAAGNWRDAFVWEGGIAPARVVALGDSVILRHSISYNYGGDMNIRGVLYINAGEILFPSARSVLVESTGRFIILDGRFVQSRFVGGGDTGTPQSGTFKNSGGYIEVRNSYVEVAQDWVSEAGGKRVFYNGCLHTGQNYTVTDIASIDTLSNVILTLGAHGSGSFSLTSATIYFNKVRAEVRGSSGHFQLSSGVIAGNITSISISNPTNSGGKIKGDVSVIGSVGLQVYGAYNSLSLEDPANKYAGELFDRAQAQSYFLTTCATAPEPLPLKLVSFTGSENNGYAMLNWRTTDESSIHHFEVQKQAANEFKTMGFISAHNSSSNSYAFRDFTGQDALSLYRLKIIEEDGQVKYSHVIKLSGSGASKLVTNSHFSQSITGLLTTQHAEKVSIELVTLQSQNVFSETRSVANGSNSFTINTSHLPSGLYLLKVTGPRITIQQKVIKTL